MNRSSSLNRLERSRAQILIVDIQKRLARIMQTSSRWRDRLESLTAGARLLDIPMLITEQNPEKLGATDDDIELPADVPILPKMSFSCWQEPAVREALVAAERPQVILAGIETHICVQATGLDLIREGFEVFLAADCCSTRLAHTGSYGVERLAAAGAVVGSSEGFLFECLDRCDEDSFRAILPIVRDMR